ncbi:MAG TPA: CGNR zinc finger domain-containing protein [Nocardioidaceae bacterium]|nr:CGNR zinc finger domain-containing protein [Nocardioidaceae bacterium]
MGGPPPGQESILIFSHDTEHSLGCLVDLVNSDLSDLDALDELVRGHDVSEVATLRPSDLDAVRRLAADLRPVFGADDAAAAATLVNSLVSRSPVTPRLTDHDGYDLHIHYFAPGASLAEHLAVDLGMALAQVIAAGEHERLRRCEAPDCDQVLVDLSRNRSKRYCDARTCGNRLHVAAYRERQRAIS